MRSAISAIKFWNPNTVWFLNYDIRKTFDGVNRNRLKNLFLTHFPQEYMIWGEIAKMQNVGIITFGDEKTSVIQENMLIPQGSIISPFLFNGPKFVHNARFKNIRPTTYLKNAVKGTAIICSSISQCIKTRLNAI